ncbi:hypothetical protein PFISCL1PPCAC_16957 [Pristionchus fissidentatus]|uniref:Uncharacterized protein n=1 Tax=Pristionchus fissidentatus TaxID=1538716 RepID=A0AAV5W4Q0_9BILA|nr:hypothetical protein PFISCL1PPCAC_16957 [Pristionchus fissidentatus]
MKQHWGDIKRGNKLQSSMFLEEGRDTHYTHATLDYSTERVGGARLRASAAPNLSGGGKMLSLEEHARDSAHLLLLLDEDLEVLVDDGDGEQNSGSGSNGSYEVSSNGEGSDAETSEGSSGRDVSAKLVDHRLLTVTAHDHGLLLELLSNVLGGGSRHVNPRLREEGARSEHEHNVDDAVEGILEHVRQRLGRRQVVADTSGGVAAVSSRGIRPGTEKVDEDVSAELGRKHLRDDVEVGDEGGLEDDGDVGGVEELDGVRRVLSTVSGRLDGKVDTEALQIDDDSEHEDGGHQVHEVGKVLSVEGLTESTDLVVSGGEEVEEGDDGSLEFGSAASVHRSGRERLPHDRLADVGGDEERNSRAETISLLEQLVEQQHNETGEHELDNDEQADSGANVGRLSVESRSDVHDGLSDSDHHSEELLGSVEEGAVLGGVSDLDDLGSGEELHDQTRGDDGRDTELHQGSPVGGHDDAQPVERIGRVGRHDS